MILPPAKSQPGEDPWDRQSVPKAAASAVSPVHTQTHALAGSSSLCATQTGQTNTGIISGRRAASLAGYLAAHRLCETRAGKPGRVLPGPEPRCRSDAEHPACLELPLPRSARQGRRRGRVHARGSSWLPAHPQRSRACPAPSKAPSQPQEKRLVAEARGWLWGDGSCPCSPGTASSPEVSAAAAQHLWHTRNILLLTEPPLLCDGHQDLLRGRGSRCRNPPGTMTDLHTCDRHCWIQPRSLPDPPWVLPRPARAMPGQSTVVNPDPARSNRQGDQFNQFSTTATHTAALGTGTGAQNPGQDLPAPCSWNLSTGLRGDHPNSTAKGLPSPDHSSQAAPTQLHLQQDHSVLPRGLSSLLPQLAELLSPREMGQGWAAFVSSQLFQPGNAAADPEAKPIPEQVVPCPGTFPAGLQLCLGAETHLLGEQTWGWLLLQGSPRYRR